METNRRNTCTKNYRHIDIKYFWLKDRVNKKEVEIQYYLTHLRLADYFTKPLQGKLFRRFREVIMGYKYINDLLLDTLFPLKERVENRDGIMFENVGVKKNLNIEVTYADCNFVIQPNYNKLWEIEVPELYDEVTIEIRNAKTGVIVYQKDITAYENFIWQGYDLSNNQLEMGNYVYWFKSATKGVFSKGQITIVK